MARSTGAATSPRRGRPPGDTAAATRGRVLTAARAELAARGYEATSLRTVAAAAGVALPTLYHHFGSKAGLFAAAYQEADARFLTAMRGAVAAHTGFAERLAAMVGAARALHAEDPTVAGLLSVGQVELARSAELAGARGPDGDALPSLVATVVADAVAAGELPAGTDPAGVVAVLSALALGVALSATVVAPQGADALFDAWQRLVTGRLLGPAPD